jgi:hypothetical protein
MNPAIQITQPKQARGLRCRDGHVWPAIHLVRCPPTGKKPEKRSWRLGSREDKRFGSTPTRNAVDNVARIRVAHLPLTAGSSRVPQSGFAAAFACSITRRVGCPLAQMHWMHNASGTLGLTTMRSSGCKERLRCRPPHVVPMTPKRSLADAVEEWRNETEANRKRMTYLAYTKSAEDRLQFCTKAIVPAVYMPHEVKKVRQTYKVMQSDRRVHEGLTMLQDLPGHSCPLRA